MSDFQAVDPGLKPCWEYLTRAVTARVTFAGTGELVTSEVTRACEHPILKIGDQEVGLVNQPVSSSDHDLQGAGEWCFSCLNILKVLARMTYGSDRKTNTADP